MSAIHGAIIGHVVKRGISAAHEHFNSASPEYIARLQHDAELYDQAGPQGEVTPQQILPVLITGFITLLIIASIRYTIGDVMAALAMIESPSSTAIIEPKPPAYTDEKEPLMPSEAEADVEITVINHKPITSKIVTTIGLLHRVGGFRARWRGLGLSVVYHGLHAMLTNFISELLGFTLLGHSLVFVFVSICLARLHMLWTHTMIAQPTSKPFWRRMVPRQQCKALLLPSLVLALAEQATFMLPLAVAVALNVPQMHREQAMHAIEHEDCGKVIIMALRVLAVPATALIVGLAVLLPASVTLTRIEATLLPEGMETIVPFDREAIVGSIDTSVRGGCKALFVEAWRSFDRAARLRLVKLYAKMVLVQVTIAFIGLHLMVAEVYLVGGEKLAVFAKSVHAQVKLMMIEAHQNAQGAN